jgi:hypothetical protein
MSRDTMPHLRTLPIPVKRAQAWNRRTHRRLKAESLDSVNRASILYNMKTTMELARSGREMASKSVWIVGAEHEAFGVEGSRHYFGSRLGAQRAANRIARRGGHGWRPFITFFAESP